MTTDLLSMFHEWLFDATKRGQATVRELMEDISIMRKNKCDCAGLPDNGITCQQWLERLATTGCAVRLDAEGKPAHDGLWWAWGQGTKAVKETQNSLFG